MKLGIVGTGLIVETLFQFISEIKEIEVKAICSTINSKNKMINMAETNHIENRYTDYDLFLKDTSFDTVYVAIPNNLHYSYSKKALLAGKNVICEKPFTTNHKQALALADLALEKHLFLIEAISNIYTANYQKIKELLPTLGDIKIVSLNYTQYSSRYDLFKQGIIKPAFNINCSGGALMDLNVYNIHFVTGLFGQPQNVYYYPNIERDIDTSGILIMDYDDFKVTSIAAKDCGAPLLNAIEGNKGCIYFETAINKLSEFSYQLNKQEAQHFAFNSNDHRMKAEFIKFADMIDNDLYDECKKQLDHSLAVMSILTQARVSADLRFPDDANI